MQLASSHAQRPQFAGTWQQRSFQSYPYYLYTQTPVTPKEIEAEQATIQAAFQKVEADIKALPASMELTYIPRVFHKTKYRAPSFNEPYNMEDRVDYALVDTIIIGYNNKQAKPSDTPILGSLFKGLFEAVTGLRDNMLALERKEMDGWRFWRAEPVEKFVKLAVKKAQELAPQAS